MPGSDEDYLNSLTEPVELTNLQVSASGSMHLNHEWVAYLDEAELPAHVVGIDDNLHHTAHEEGSAYA